ncbi:MAG: cytochrome c-type biogenesis protein [Thermodesulfobacteriota bacterium]
MINKFQTFWSLFYKSALMLIISICLSSSSIADTIDEQVREISYLLMCPVCQGQTVEESNSPLANDMRAIIRKKLQQGESKEEIIAYFVDRYGETILGAPPAKGTNWVLWLLPAFALLAGGLGIGLFIYRSKREKSDKFEKEPKEALTHVNTEYIDKINKELKDFES